jgi:hypothetical protein
MQQGAAQQQPSATAIVSEEPMDPVAAHRAAILEGGSGAFSVRKASKAKYIVTINAEGEVIEIPIRATKRNGTKRYMLGHIECVGWLHTHMLLFDRPFFLGFVLLGGHKIQGGGGPGGDGWVGCLSNHVRCLAISCCL